MNARELILGLSFATGEGALALIVSRADHSLADPPAHGPHLIAAVSSLAKKSYQTMVNSSLIYEAANRQLGAIRPLFERFASRSRDPGQGVFARAEQANISAIRGCGDSDVLKAAGYSSCDWAWDARPAGRKSRAFVDFLFAQFPRKGIGHRRAR